MDIIVIPALNDKAEFSARHNLTLAAVRFAAINIEHTNFNYSLIVSTGLTLAKPTE